MLLASTEEEEVRKVLFHMHPYKFPGPEDMNPGFYLKFWNMVGGDVVKVVKKFFES